MLQCDNKTLKIKVENTKLDKIQKSLNKKTCVFPALKLITI